MPFPFFDKLAFNSVAGQAALRRGKPLSDIPFYYPKTAAQMCGGFARSYLYFC